MNKNETVTPIVHLNVFPVELIPNSARTIEIAFFGRWHIWFVCWVDIFDTHKIRQRQSK